MLPKGKTFTRTLYIHAVPKTEYELRYEENSDPFKYEISEYELPWRDGGIVLEEHEITLTLRSDHQVEALSVASLREKQQEILAESEVKLKELDEQIAKLLSLTYQPEEPSDA
jgi:hypothetical protein